MPIFQGEWQSMVNGTILQDENLIMDKNAGGFFVVKRKRPNAPELVPTINGDNIVFIEPNIAGTKVDIYTGQLIIDFVDAAGRRIGIIRGRRVTLNGSIVGGVLNAATLESSDDWTSTRPPGT
jgi:hypothetical protein